MPDAIHSFWPQMLNAKFRRGKNEKYSKGSEN